MQTRSVKDLCTGVRDDIADLKTVRAIPTPAVDMIDPFLFLNHHGPQVYPKNNHGLPFGPHPHRGFETVTFILQGDLTHKDNAGHESIIKSGGVQWMTAGRGLVHSEVSSSEFMAKGGPLEILQLWVNLPSRLKMTPPKYTGLQSFQIPVYESAGGKVQTSLVSGILNGHHGVIKPLVDITTMTTSLSKGATWNISISPERNIFFYVVRGEVQVNTVSATGFQFIRFNSDGSDITVEAHQDSLILLCHAVPFKEPVVAHGPFVMNTRAEIQQALRDYQAGKFGPS